MDLNNAHPPTANGWLCIGLAFLGFLGALALWISSKRKN